MPKFRPHPSKIKDLAFEKEILRLQRKIAKLDVENISLRHTLAVLREYPEGAGNFTRAEMYHLVKRGKKVLAEFEAEHQKTHDDT